MGNNLIQTIEGAERNAKAVGLQLRAVTIAMPYDSPRAVLTLAWYSDDTPFEAYKSPLPGVSAAAWSAPDDTVLTIDAPEEIAILGCAWYFGAPDLSRHERRPPPAQQDPRDPGYGLLAAFGLCRATSDYGPIADPIIAGADRAESDRMLTLAVARGWVTYTYKPGYKRSLGADSIVDDASLDTTGHRRTPLPAWCKPVPLGEIAATADARQQIWEWSPVSTLIPLAHWQAKHRGDNFAEALALAGKAIHGDLWQAALARDLGVSARSLRTWAAGRDNIPAGVRIDLARMCAELSSQHQARATTLAMAAEKLGRD